MRKIIFQGTFEVPDNCSYGEVIYRLGVRLKQAADPTIKPSDLDITFTEVPAEEKEAS